MRAQRSAGALEAARATHAARTRAPRCHLQDLTRRPHLHRHGRDHCHHAGSPAPQCRILACSADRRLLARASARRCAGSSAQNSQLWSPRGRPPAGYMFTLPERGSPSGIVGSWPTVRLDRGWRLACPVPSPPLPRPIYRVTCPSRTQLHARSQVLAMHRGLMYRIIGHYHFQRLNRCSVESLGCRGRTCQLPAAWCWRCGGTMVNAATGGPVRGVMW